jgi:hypothetical protein
MAIGFRSFAAFWIGGISSTGIPTPEPSCPCPEWLPDGTLLNSFTNLNEATCVGYDQTVTLANNFLQIAEQSGNSFKQGITLTSNWVKRNCE